MDRYSLFFRLFIHNHNIINIQVYTWGQNTFGQLGDSTRKHRTIPQLIEIKHKITNNKFEGKAISCGKSHSLVRTTRKTVYFWGSNQFGQLGYQFSNNCESKNWINDKPFFNYSLKNITVVKAVCGPNHTLLLTGEGHVYGFGDNRKGQIETGNNKELFVPIRIDCGIKFKDIITHFENDLSIGISTDDEYYVWGLADNKKVLSPQLIPDSKDESVFNIYAKYASNKITFNPIFIRVKNETQNKTKKKSNKSKKRKSKQTKSN